VSGKTCWLVYVDALLLNIGGNLHDVLNVAAKARPLTSLA
jgi:exosome complex RNA-binding protein Rrp42 (RNase PH superfamily)